MDLRRLASLCARIAIVTAALVAFSRDAAEVQALTFTVNSTADTGDPIPDGVCNDGTGNCTLREALQEAAFNGGADTIGFSIGLGVKTITVGTALPAINGPLTIDGLTQRSGTMMLNFPCYLLEQHPCIEINGNNVNADGLVIAGGPATIRGLVINRFLGNGIRTFNSSSNNRIEYNYIGTNMDGTADLGNGNSFDEGGIRISGTGNIIGGTAGFLPTLPALPTANLISGNNAYGVIIENGSSTGNTVLGNYVGTNRAGTGAIGNTQGGVLLDNTASGNTIGGTSGTTPAGSCAGACNLISGNGTSGVEILDGSTVNSIQGNFIGTNVAGTGALANDSGVFIGQAPSNTIGGNTAAARNLISGNNSIGVSLFGAGAQGNVISGNYIGTTNAGSAALPNGAQGIRIADSDGAVIGGTTGTTPGGSCTGACNLISGNDGSGVEVVESATTNSVLGNFIGTNATGTAGLANGAGFTTAGVRIIGSPGNAIGGTSAASRNVISGNDNYGVLIGGAGASGNVVSGNYLGANTTGMARIPNRHGGVQVEDSASGNTIGGTAGTTPGGSCTGACNLVSGNGITPNQTGANGIDISGGSTGNVIQGNFVGVNVTGAAALENTTTGVSLSAANNTIGGTSANARNVISGNRNVGLSVQGDGVTILGNHIGTNSAGTAAIPNSTGADNSGIFVVNAQDITIGGTAGTTPGGSCSGSCNLISGNGGDGIRLFGLDGLTVGGAVIQGNYIGTNATGTGPVPNTRNGLTLETSDGTVTDATVGGAEASARNVISGNGQSGVKIDGENATGNLVQGNLIGTDASGSMALGNQGSGVSIDGAAGNTIGSPGAAGRNVISGNGSHGVEIIGEGATANQVEGNFIGTDASGTQPLGNDFFGLRIDNGATANEARGNTIGGNTAGIRISSADTSGHIIAGNFIGTNEQGSPAIGNLAEGVYISNSSGNTIGGDGADEGNVVMYNAEAGVRVQDSDATMNAISGNAIDVNGGPGIQLDNGANEDQEAPVLTSAETGSTQITGSLLSGPNREHRIEFFASPACDPLGTGEGASYLGFSEVTTAGGGDADFDVTLAGTAQPGGVVTATATDADGNTSAFSNCVIVTGTATPTPTPTPASATPSGTPNGSATPTPTPTPTGQTPTPTPTPTPSGQQELTQGDVDCDEDNDSVDALKTLQDVAAIPYSQNDACPGIGNAVPASEAPDVFGDVDCDGDVDAVDALKMLQFLAAIPYNQNEPCTDIGELMNS